MLKYERRSIHVVEATVTDVLESLLVANRSLPIDTASMLRAFQTDGVYRIEPYRVTYEAQQKPANIILWEFLNRRGVDYAFMDGAVGDRLIDYRVKALPFMEAVRGLLKIANPGSALSLEYWRGVHYLRSPLKGGPTRKLTYSFDQADLQAALESVFRANGASYVISGIKPSRVTLAGQQKAFREVLEDILRNGPGRQDPPLTYSFQGGIYRIRIRPEVIH